MTVSDQLRKLAQELRHKAERLEENKTIKCAHVIRSAVALQLLQRKISGGK